MRSKFPIAKILILVTILALPGFLYYLLKTKGQNRYKPLPVYGPKVLSGTFSKRMGNVIPDTIFHSIKDFKAVNQDGKEFVLDSIKKKLIVVNFFYTSCNKACPEVFKNIDWLHKEYKDNEVIKFLSISVDPEKDNSKVLNDFAKSLGVISGKWDFVTADTSVIYPLAKEQFFLNALKTNDGYIHSDKIVLLDVNHRIRGYYDGASPHEVKNLGDEIKVLITEELRKIKVDK